MGGDESPELADASATSAPSKLRRSATWGVADVLNFEERPM